MHSAESQAHHQFKVFTGALGSGGSVDALATQVETFVSERGVAPKSIGVEFLESMGKLVLSLGYRDDEPGYAVRLSTHPCGRIDDPSDLSGLEASMSAAAASMQDVLCHELFVTGDGEFVMIFMARA